MTSPHFEKMQPLAEGSAQGTSSERPGTASSTSSERPIAALVVDDDALTRKLMTRMLSRMGCIVEEAENGQMVVDILLGTGGQGPRYLSVAFALLRFHSLILILNAQRHCQLRQLHARESFDYFFVLRDFS
jgi:hypothetical protein